MSYIAKKEGDKVRVEYLHHEELKDTGLALLTIYYTPEKVEELFKAEPIDKIYRSGEVVPYKGTYKAYTDLEELFKNISFGYIYYFDGERWFYDYLNSREDFDNIPELLIEMTI